jgi:predicted ester cyclase
MTGVTEPRFLVRRFYDDLWNAWNDDAVDEVLADDFIFRGSLAVETRGREGWRDYRDIVRRGSPDFHNEVVDLVCEGHRAAVRLRCSGHHAGPLLGLDGTGRAFQYAAAAFFTSDGGRLKDAWVLGDLESLRGQLEQT